MEVSNWLHQVGSLYLTVIPIYLYVNNFLGPKVMEPVFCRDFLMAQFDRIATAPSTTQGQSAAFVPSAGKAPRLPKVMFTRASASPRVRIATVGMQGLAAIFRR